jgi:hypothetical protein
MNDERRTELLKTFPYTFINTPGYQFPGWACINSNASVDLVSSGTIANCRVLSRIKIRNLPANPEFSEGPSHSFCTNISNVHVWEPPRPLV